MNIDAHSRGGYGYDRGPYPPPPYQTGRRGPPDPHTFDYPATLKQYAEWFRYYHAQQAMEEDNADKAAEQEAGDGSKPRNGIRSRWEKYKKEFAAQQVRPSCVFPLRECIDFDAYVNDQPASAHVRSPQEVAVRIYPCGAEPALWARTDPTIYHMGEISHPIDTGSSLDLPRDVNRQVSQVSHDTASVG